MVSMRAGNNPRCFRLLWYPRPTQAIIINGKNVFTVMKSTVLTYCLMSLCSEPRTTSSFDIEL